MRQFINNRTALVLACACVHAGLFALPAAADGVSGSYSVFDSGYTGYENIRKTTFGGPPVTSFGGSAAGTWSSVSMSLGVGYESITADATVPVYDYSHQVYASAGGSGQWGNTVTIYNPTLTGQVGILHTSFSVSGSFSSDQIPMPWGEAEGYIYVDGNTVGQVGYDGYNPSAYDPVVGHFATIPYDRSFIFGQPFDMGAGISVTMLASNYAGNYAGATLHGSMSIHGTGFSVTDNAGNSVGWSSTAGSGKAAGQNVPTGDPYTGFTVDNDIVGGHGTVMSLLDGSASSDSSIAATFIAGDPSGNVLFHSDIVDFKGTHHDMFVLELTYDPSDVADPNSLVLGWKNPATGEWTNAVNGNSDGGAHQQRINGAYVSPDDFVLGDYGVDTVNHVVWAVVDHNSEFAATTSVVPEPGTMALMMGGAAMMIRRRRK